jgi:hypothetical protein
MQRTLGMSAVLAFSIAIGCWLAGQAAAPVQAQNPGGRQCVGLQTGLAGPNDVTLYRVWNDGTVEAVLDQPSPDVIRARMRGMWIKLAR